MPGILLIYHNTLRDLVKPIRITTDIQLVAFISPVWC